MGKTGKTSFPWSVYIGPKPGNSKPYFSNVGVNDLILKNVWAIQFTGRIDQNYQCSYTSIRTLKITKNYKKHKQRIFFGN